MVEGQDIENGNDGAQRGRRRSKRTKSKSTPGALRQWWWKYGTLAMVLVTGAWLSFGYLKLYSQGLSYDIIGVGVNEPGMLYAAGPPNQKIDTATGRRWVYRDGDRVAVVDFDHSGILFNFLCTSMSQSPRACRPSHGIQIGTDELSMWNRLGMPSHERLDGTGKYSTYQGIGLTVRLEKGLVTAISRQPSTSKVDLIPQVLRSLIP